MAVALENRALAQNNVSKALNTSKYSPEKTFSNLFKSVTSIPQDSTKKPQIIQDFLKLANLFLEPEELTLEQEIQIFLTEYKNLSKTEAKNNF